MARNRRDEDEEDDRPRRRRRDEDEEEEEERPRKRRRNDDEDERVSSRPNPRRRDEDEDEDDERPRRRRRSTSADLTFTVQDLEGIAKAQKGIIVTLLIHFSLVIFNIAVLTPLTSTMPDGQRILINLGFVVFVLANAITSAVFTFMLSLKVYSTAVGVLLGLLCLVPCINFLVLLIINQKAIATLKANGISVGFLGADLSQFSRKRRRRDEDEDDE